MMPAESSNPAAIKVLLVDDSAMIRGLISRCLKRLDYIDIIGTASDGEIALSVLQRNRPDVVLLDIEMPNKNGLETLPEIIRLSPNTNVIMCSSLTQRNAEISMKALELGAADYIPKPTSAGDMGTLEDFYRQLIDKVTALGRAAQSTAGHKIEQKAAAAFSIATPAAEQRVASIAPVAAPKPEGIKGALRLPHIKVLAIASSTGGPQALLKLLRQVKPAQLRVPVFITQHMPPSFTKLLAEHISQDTGIPAHEGVDGESVRNGQIYIAPGDYHMRVRGTPELATIELGQDAPVNYCRPAADPMFDSIVEVYGKSVLGVVLTGMGHDGRSGSKRIKDAGGALVVQDKESSVVWGMPGAVAALGIQDAIQTIDDIAATIHKAMG